MKPRNQRKRQGGYRGPQGGYTLTPSFTRDLVRHGLWVRPAVEIVPLPKKGRRKIKWKVVATNDWSLVKPGDEEAIMRGHDAREFSVRATRLGKDRNVRDPEYYAISADRLLARKKTELNEQMDAVRNKIFRLHKKIPLNNFRTMGEVHHTIPSLVHFYQQSVELSRLQMVRYSFEIELMKAVPQIYNKTEIERLENTFTEWREKHAEYLHKAKELPKSLYETGLYLENAKKMVFYDKRIKAAEKAQKQAKRGGKKATEKTFRRQKLLAQYAQAQLRLSNLSIELKLFKLYDFVLKSRSREKAEVDIKKQIQTVRDYMRKLRENIGD